MFDYQDPVALPNRSACPDLPRRNNPACTVVKLLSVGTGAPDLQGFAMTFDLLVS